MNRTEKINLINDVIEIARCKVLAKIDKMPEEWQGLEIRQYIADSMESHFKMPKKMKKEYNNTILINNL